ncbi:sigma-54 interaction domain-containing protein [Faecalispora anaeroviscerum]|uniref:sigma-54 interaction domain-containing protein n=1 Tax=Faecalispora anaeroviscerum TaxID=2991836 RepID=UPI0024B891EA|nr:sigma 54-interacting transcriptional regulator [Faecalispora anaeroviscerum]
MQDFSSFQELCQALPFTEVLDNIDTGIALYDAQGNFIFMNTVMVNWRNIPRKEYLKMNVHDFSHVLDVSVFDLVCQEKRRVSRLQYYKDFQQVDGPTRMRIVIGTPIFDGQGNVKYVVTTLQDVQDFEDLYHTLLNEHKILRSGNEVGQAEKVSIVAKSPQFRQLLSVAESIAPLDSTVLIYGESGCGKEVIAHYIHEYSDRKSKPLITVNCAAFPENLIEAELFGYEKGSFTGANREGKAGLVEAADGGTLFLDELNSLPMNVQGKLLRCLEEKSVQRIGATRAKNVDFRLIAATNQNLEEMVRRGTFREDLYYRIHVIPLTIPPVRERKEDIVPLCLHFLHHLCQKYNLQKSFSDEVLEEVRNYNWPGNVREIRNFVERMVVMTPHATREIKSIPSGMLSNETDTAQQLPQSAGFSPQNHPGQRSDGPSRDEVLVALATCGNHREKAAQYLGISRRKLQYKIREYHLSSRCHYQDENSNE